MNQMLKFLKFGFGKVTEQASGAIRNGVMTRGEAIELVKLYDGKCSDRFISQFCRYVDITEEQFWKIAESYRNLDIWEKTGDAETEWRLKYPVE